MFKIINLKLFSINQEEYTYEFAEGINYFQGENDTGKTVFYSFLDYMFGSSVKREEEWFENLDYVEIDFIYRAINFSIKRTLFQDLNYIKYTQKGWGKPISLEKYKEKLNSIFTKEDSDLRILRDFTQKDLTFRSFTLFNFLGEKSLGNIQDFFDKCKDIKYSINLPTILNFIFNENLKEIFQIEEEIKKLKDKLSSLEIDNSEYKLNNRIINDSLMKLDAKVIFNGKNTSSILDYLIELKNSKEDKKNKKMRTISELQTLLHNISEQIRIYENRLKDTKQFEAENENRLLLINELDNLVSNQNEYKYLISPIQNMIDQINTNISFSKYYINDGTIKKLKEEKEKIKDEIKANDSRFFPNTMDEKSFLIKFIEESLSKNTTDKSKEIEEIQKQIKELNQELVILKNKDDINKIDKLSDYITLLYLSANSTSIVSRDEKSNISIKYIKKGNILQPTITYQKEEEIIKENAYLGSNARHTLIQFCGYLGFMRLLIDEKKFPIIPFLVFDHISKPFDLENNKAIGKVLNEFYKTVPKNHIQIILFDNESPENLAIDYDKFNNLESEGKSGFNPFFYKEKKK